MVPPIRIVLLALAAGLLAVVAVPGGATSATGSRGDDVVSRRVVFSVVNSNDTAVACEPDNRPHRLHATLVGPRDTVLGTNIERANVLVHDLTTGGWFWHLRSHPGQDYAGRLAAHGETSLVLDRLGYDASPLADGNATCLGAQADMLHQVVQHLRSGQYDFVAPTAQMPPPAQHVVLHGHSVGAGIAELEAGEYADVDGLVLMSWSDTGASRRAVDEAAQQSKLCLAGRDYASFAQGPREFRHLFFASAPAPVQRDAATRRSPSPCGDPLSLAQLLAAAPATTRSIDVPVLLMFGARDVLTRGDAPERQSQAYAASTPVTTRVIAGAGSALPLERSARTTRTRVLRWLGRL